MSARILIVEDNAANRELMDYLLRAFGFETMKAADGAIGLEIARRERPDLILCDIQMPVLDGYAFAHDAKTDPSLREIPLVAVTAFAMVGDRDRVLSHGFDGYIAKPLEPLAFIQAVNAALPTTLRANEAPQPQPTFKRLPPRGVTVLVVDDSPMNLELKRDLLEPHGYTVVTAGTPTHALRLAREHRPALILSDVGMSEGSGFDFIRTVKADLWLRDIPFIFLSSTHQDEASRALGLQLGALRYLQRPMESALLLAEIEACLAHR
ncbi:response regulator [Rhizobacter sp. OV335]|jgi:two-component system cell cycle response regulator|uniref:response regulator n=1 Tax=Rhizobacter sp. OV335 TaxID=1500264 RepID=UPI000914F5E2|nr:response regulator [Rhizobacter sp. OV335]SHN15143.1 two-component system, cell cycle response regulator [Rhizobacter sp. OV335]